MGEVDLRVAIVVVVVAKVVVSSVMATGVGHDYCVGAKVPDELQHSLDRESAAAWCHWYG